jgi:sugar phosphate isomerase/epimerase
MAANSRWGVILILANVYIPFARPLMTWVLGRCAEMTAQRSLRLGLELRVGEAISNMYAFLRLHDAVRSPNLGVVFDAAHLRAKGNRAGPLFVARYLEPLAMLWIHLAHVERLGPNIAFKLLKR